MAGEKKIKRIWILNHHASGDGDRHDELANHLIKQGIEVIVIASSYLHSEQKYIFENQCFIQNKNNGLRYVWLRTTPIYKGNGIKRILNMISYMNMIKRYTGKLYTDFGKPDVVIGSSVHPFAWEAAYWISKKTGADFIAEVRDLWPLSLIEIYGISSKHPISMLFGLLEKKAYSRAKRIITTMPYAYKYISDELGFPREKLEWIPNGIDTERIDSNLNNPEIMLPEDLNNYLEDNWCAVYTGSLVESECIPYILDTAKILQDRGNNIVKFAIVGDGHLKNYLIIEAKKLGLKNVHFFETVPKEKVAIIVNKAKICLASVKNLNLYRYGLSMNKLSDYLYSGNPTIFVCDVDNVVKTSGGGFTLPFGKRDLFAKTIERVYEMSDEEKSKMAEKGKQIIKEQYDSSVIARKLLDLLKSN